MITLRNLTLRRGFSMLLGGKRDVLSRYGLKA